MVFCLGWRKKGQGEEELDMSGIPNGCKIDGSSRQGGISIRRPAEDGRVARRMTALEGEGDGEEAKEVETAAGKTGNDRDGGGKERKVTIAALEGGRRSDGAREEVKKKEYLLGKTEE